MSVLNPRKPPDAQYIFYPHPRLKKGLLLWHQQAEQRAGVGLVLGWRDGGATSRKWEAQEEVNLAEKEAFCTSVLPPKMHLCTDTTSPPPNTTQKHTHIHMRVRTHTQHSVFCYHPEAGPLPLASPTARPFLSPAQDSHFSQGLQHLPSPSAKAASPASPQPGVAAQDTG